jgi:ADP-ribose pyrophosphatase YjhB (NUDIX family)
MSIIKIKRFIYKSDGGGYELNDCELAKIILSSYSKRYYDKILLSVYFSEDVRILCVYYNKHGVYSDTQAGITGKCKKGEKFKDAVDRELREEIGIRLEDAYDAKPLIRINEYECYVIDVSHTIPLDKKSPIDENDEKCDDDFDCKFAVFVTGTRTQLTRLLMKICAKDHDKETKGVDIMTFQQLNDLFKA